MCDCTTEKKDDEKNKPETVTLFETCKKFYRPKEIVDTNDCDCNDKNNEIGLMKKDLNDLTGCCDSLKQLSLSDSSSDSSRMYKFVSPRVPKCYDNVEEGETTSFIFEPCIKLLDELEKESEIEYTLAIVKPEATIYRRQIEQRIYEEGFEIRQTRWLQLTPEQASEFYSDNYEEIGFARLIVYMSSGPIIIHVLSKHNAVQDWRFIIGPTIVSEARLYFPDSIRAKYGRRGEDFKNAVHGSLTREKAEREIHFFFPESIIEPLLKGEAIGEYLWETINPILTEGLTMCCKLKPADPLLWLAHWLILNNPNKPRLSEDLAFVPT